MMGPVNGGIFLNVLPVISEETQDFLRAIKNPALSSGLPEPDNVAGWSRLQELVERNALPQSDLLVERFAPAIAGISLGGVPVLDIRPRNWKEKNKIAIYTHGGGFTLYSAASTLGRAALFADDTALRVLSVDYTLAPVATFEEISTQVVTAVRALLHEGYRLQDTLMFGDSSGGGLTVAVILKLRDLGLGLPAAAVLVSPGIDLTPADDASHPAGAAVLSSRRERAVWRAAGTAPFVEGKVPTPSIYADFSSGFPPTLIQGGTKEALLDGFVRLYHALDLTGVQVRLDLYEGMTHNFQFRQPDAPEAQMAWRKIRDFVRLHFTPEKRHSAYGRPGRIESAKPVKKSG